MAFQMQAGAAVLYVVMPVALFLRLYRVLEEYAALAEVPFTLR